MAESSADRPLRLPEKQFTDEDVQRVAKVFCDETGRACTGCTMLATDALTALAAAGRLLPDGADREWGVRSAWVEKDMAFIHQFPTRDEAEANLHNSYDLVTRVVGPWVEADGATT